MPEHGELRLFRKWICPGIALHCLPHCLSYLVGGGKFEATPEERDWNKRKRGNENMICIGNPQSFAFAEDVIDALIEIFPSQYIHFGGMKFLLIFGKNVPNVWHFTNAKE